MKTVCAWCEKNMRNKRESLRVQLSRAFSRMWKKIKGTASQEEVISHGICDNCKKKLLQSVDEE